MATILAVCKSKKKGTKKDTVMEGLFIENYGMEGDAHADSTTHRQTSLLDIRSIDKMRDIGLDVKPGDFAENLTTEGIDLVSLPVGTNLLVGDNVSLQITQIGKECHTRCAIYRQVGTCIMPEEGVFARVIRGGVIRAGDTIRIDNDGK